MSPLPISRRTALKALAATGLGLAAGGRSSPHASQGGYRAIPSWPTELRELAPGVYAYTQAGGPGMDGGSISNAGVIDMGDHLIAVDTLGPPIHAKAFRAAARAATGKEFRRVINTHHHRDHTHGNCFFLPSEIVAHEYTRQAIVEMGIPAKPFAERPEWQEGMSELRLAPPTMTFSERVTFVGESAIVEVRFIGPGHTWGDSVVYLPRQRILFGGDVAFWYITPAAHNGHVSRWIEAIDRILGMGVDTIVPGHGAIGGKVELGETKAYLELLRREVRRRYDAGMRPGQAAADIPLGRFAAWSNPERVVVNTLRLFAEFDGTIAPSTANLVSPDENGRKAMEEYRSLTAARKSG
jgi:cyclase